MDTHDSIARVWYATGMTFRQYASVMIATSALAFAAWGVVVTRMNPQEGGWLAISVFFLTLFLGLVGVFATASMAYRVGVLRHAVVLREARIAFRQAALLSFAGCLLLFLASQELFSLVSTLVVIGSVSLLEYLSLRLDRLRRG